jgi:hypothetical protein
VLQLNCRETILNMGTTTRRPRGGTGKPSVQGEQAAGADGTGPTEALPIILAALDGIEEGSVEVVVHEGRITYIERREKEQVAATCPSPTPG